MKKLSKILALILALACLFAFTACGKNQVTIDGDSVIITADSKEYDLEGKMLIDYMEALKEDGKLVFEMSGTMVVSIDGKANTSNSFWMLYCDDEENSNATWGTVEYNGKTFASAAFGATELPLKDGVTYIWTYQTF